MEFGASVVKPRPLHSLPAQYKVGGAPRFMRALRAHDCRRRGVRRTWCTSAPTTPEILGIPKLYCLRLCIRFDMYVLGCKGLSSNHEKESSWPAACHTTRSSRIRHSHPGAFPSATPILGLALRAWLPQHCAAFTPLRLCRVYQSIYNSAKEHMYVINICSVDGRAAKTSSGAAALLALAPAQLSLLALKAGSLRDK